MRQSLKAWIPGAGGVLAAGASALCCAGPVLAAAVGLSGAGLSATFEPLRPWFLAMAAALLLAGFWLLHREERKACEPGQPCADPAVRRLMKVVLWTATIVSVILATLPRWQIVVS